MEMTNKEFLKEFYDMRSKKMAKTDKELAEYFGFSSVVEMRKKVSQANAEEREILRKEVLKLKEAGMTNSEIAEKIGKRESSVRLLLETK